MTRPGGGQRCPCGTGLVYGQCCGRYHDGGTAPTAEALMRSRFCAFITEDAEYLLRTWDPQTRPEQLSLAGSPVRFQRLDILDVEGGGPLDQTGVVEFEAFYTGEVSGSQRERSTFRRVGGAWVYSAGDVS